MGKYSLPLGFRFHPTDVELVKYYLKRKILGKKFIFEAIAELDIYKHAPWDLPDMSLLKTGDLKWFFFCPIEKKYGKGASSYAPESQCAEPSVLSSGLHTLPSPSVVDTDAAISLAPGIDSNDPHVPAVTSDAELALTFADAPQVPAITSDATCMDAPQVPAVTSNANDVLTCMDVTQIPMVVDAMAVPALMEAPQIAHLPQVQESNDDIISMLDIFTEEDYAFFTYFSGEMTGSADNLPVEPPQVSEDNEIAWMLESFKEDDNQNNLWYP
ncbi:No apical meristem (NAM) protein [Corchorus olitorius]|uniref:No apical meristem (NAM) protein n=1 Tax=Corchorus olitorius TaxID=93759 RepID=A0A1R3GE17_9ROSI|nr:No apical meristem (NAM) protein [Corchorus olitorius]